MIRKTTTPKTKCKSKVTKPKRIGRFGVKDDPWSDLPVSTPANKASYAFDISEYMQRQNSCKPTIIAALLKKTDKAVQIKELFGYGRTMWFPKSHIRPTPQIHSKMTPAQVKEFFGDKLSPIEHKKHLMGGVWYGDDQIEDAEGNVLIPGEVHERHKQNMAKTRGVVQPKKSTRIFGKE